MEIATVKGEPRAKGNRHALKNLRKRGMLPAVIYGHDKAPENVAVDKHDLAQAIEHGQKVLQLEINGKPQQYLLKAVQYDHLYEHPIHIDLMRVDPNEHVRVNVPIEFRGDPKGVHAGGVFAHSLTKIEIECALTNIPKTIHVDVSDLELNASLHVRDLELPEGISAVSPPETLVAHIATKRGTSAEAEAAEAEAAQGEQPSSPEVIGRTAKEEDADQG